MTILMQVFTLYKPPLPLSAVLSACTHSHSHFYPGGGSLMANNHSCTLTYRSCGYFGFRDVITCIMQVLNGLLITAPIKTIVLLVIKKSSPVSTLDVNL